jgi:hypothetical protein
MKFVAIASSLDPRGAKAFAGRSHHPAGWERLQWPNVNVAIEEETFRLLSNGCILLAPAVAVVVVLNILNVGPAERAIL